METVMNLNEQQLNKDIVSMLFMVASEIISGFNFGTGRGGKIDSVEISPEAQALLKEWGTQEKLDSIRKYGFKLKETESYKDLVMLYNGCLHEAAIQFAVHLAKSEGEDELIGYFFTYCALMSDLLNVSPAGNFRIIQSHNTLPMS
jgi:hypothetical protein